MLEFNYDVTTTAIINVTSLTPERLKTASNYLDATLVDSFLHTEAEHYDETKANHDHI